MRMWFQFALMAMASVALGFQPEPGAPEPSPPAAPADTQPAQRPPPPPPLPAAEPHHAEPPVTQTLLEAGAEPRFPIRLHPTAPMRQHIALSVGISEANETNLGDQPPPKLPAPVAVAINWRVTLIPEADGVRRTFAGETYRVDAPLGTKPEIVTGVERRMNGLQRLRVSSMVDEAQSPTSTQITLDGAVNPLMVRTIDGARNALRLLTPPRPAEPLGVGARWEVRTRLVTNSIPFDATVVYTVDSIDAETLKVSFEGTTHAQPGTIQPVYGMAPEHKLDVVEAAGTVRGKFTLSHGEIIPGKGEVTDDQRCSVTIFVRGETVPHKQHTQIRTILGAGGVASPR